MEFQHGSRRGVSRHAAYMAAALVLFLVLFGGNLPTPFYPVWQQRFGLGTGVVTAIYAVYPIGVIAGLLFGGKLADQIGRRPILAVAASFGIVAETFFIFAEGVPWLFVGRTLNGIAIGLLSGPAVAALVELEPNGDRKRGAWLGSLATVAATAFGPLLASVLLRLSVVQSLPFLVHVAALAAALLLIILVLPETRPPLNDSKPRVLSFAPQGLTVPSKIRSRFWLAATTAFLVWAIAALWLALGPALVMNALKTPDRLVGGLAVAGVLGTSGVLQLAARRVEARLAMRLSMALLPICLGLILMTVIWHSGSLLFLGCLSAGLVQGLGWMGSSEMVGRFAPPDHRAGVMSAFYVIAYAGVAVPILAVGIASDVFGLPYSIAALALLGTAAAIPLVVLLRPASIAAELAEREGKGCAGLRDGLEVGRGVPSRPSRSN